MKNLKIISGGQTGVDQGALDFALDHGFMSGGYCPKGRKSERGRIPFRYPVSEIESEDYKDRTEKNILESDATIILRDSVEIKNGVIDTISICKQLSKPFMIIKMDEKTEKEKILSWISNHQINTINVAGNRESANPGIRKKAYLFLVNLFTA